MRLWYGVLETITVLPFTTKEVIIYANFGKLQFFNRSAIAIHRKEQLSLNKCRCSFYLV